jgi:hypothetical protein
VLLLKNSSSVEEVRHLQTISLTGTATKRSITQRLCHLT